MHGERLLIADKIALKTFRKYEGCYPWNWVKMHHDSQPLNLEEWLPDAEKIYRKTRVPCSCWMCGHLRQWFDEPLQEKRQLLTLRDFEEDDRG